MLRFMVAIVPVRLAVAILMPKILIQGKDYFLNDTSICYQKWDGWILVWD
ncbi:Uncharacterised protein [Proteus mirabilis]|uniref:Uncharacterized protein n=1 Tax=Proteus mirabilis TaxID=584 RepID=A0A379GGQ3_PROMI|nr:Uncharacterised protein [Proteus mirabilis]